MRIWYGVNPKCLCRNHLLGEHREMHSMVGLVVNGMTEVVNGHVAQGQFHPEHVYRRHELLVVELLRRGYGHHSPISGQVKHLLSLSGATEMPTKLMEQAKELLMGRCEECRKAIQEEERRWGCGN